MLDVSPRWDGNVAAGGTGPVADPPATAGDDRDPDQVTEEDRAHGARGAGANFLTLLGQTSLLLFQILGARLFGAAAWGAYAFGLSALEVCGRLGVFGSDKAILVFVAARRAQGDPSGAERAIATGIRISLVLGAALAAGLLLASGAVGRAYAQPSFGEALRVLAIAVPVTALTTVLLAATMARKNLKYNLLAKGAVEPGLRIALVAAVGLTLASLRGLLLVHVVAALGTAAVAVWAFGRLYPLRRMAVGLVRAPLDGSVLRYAVPLAMSEVVNSFLGQTNVLVLGKFRPPSEVGIYAAALALSVAVSYLRGAFDTVLAPIAAEAWVMKDGARMSRNLQLYSRVILIFAAPLAGLMIVGGPALLGLHGPAFVQGSATLAILTLGHVINATMGLANWTLLASGRSRTILVNNVSAFVLNIGLCLVLVPRLGMEGAALAATLTLAAIQSLVTTESYVVWRVQPFSSGFFRLLALAVLTVGGELALYRGLGRFLGAALVLRAAIVLVAGSAIFFALAWLLCGEDERAMLRRLLPFGRKTAVLRSPPHV